MNLDAPVVSQAAADDPLVQRERYDAHVRDAALRQLAGGLAPGAHPPLSVQGTPLFIAAQAVGAHLGIAMQPAPSRAEDEALQDSVDAIAQASQIRSRRVKLPPNWWTRDGGPLVAYTQEGRHPVALIPVSARRYELVDPVRQRRQAVTAALAATLDPVAYTFHRTFSARAQRWRDVLAFALHGRQRDLAVALLTGLFATLLGMVTAPVTAVFIDRAIPDADAGMVVQLGLALLAATLGQTLCLLTQGVALLRQQTGAIYALQSALWDRLLKLHPTFFRHYTSGDLRTRMAGLSLIHKKLSGATLRTLLSSGLALFNLGLMWAYHAPLALVASAVALLLMLLTVQAGRFKLRELRPLQAVTGELSGVVVQLINSVAKLRVAAAESRAFAHWAQLFSEQQTRRYQLQRLDDRIAVLHEMARPLTAVVIFWYVMHLTEASPLTGAQALTPGGFLAFHVAFGLFMSAVTQLNTAILDLLDIVTHWERARPILQGEVETHTQQRHPGRLSGKLSLDHITFRYQASGAAILDEVSLQAEAGEFVALVGPSGSGKSTLLRLLLGFETPQAGAVYYDDQELAHLDVGAVRQQIGTVLQQSRIMSGSILENIAGGAAIGLTEAWEAVRAAGLEADIAAMPMGLHTFISEGGGNLSGGQRQRLLIARALVFKPAILYFDEATSALDNRTQAIVTESLERLQTTRLVIAHRLSTVRNADRIYVLDKGKMVQHGRFEELSRQPGLFAHLMARQIPESGDGPNLRVYRAAAHG